MLERTEDVWKALDGSRVFITGGTGFFGKWLIASLMWANRRAGCTIKASILSRSPEQFAYHFPDVVANESITMERGEVTSFPFPYGAFTHAVHAATDTSLAAHRDGGQLLRTIVAGTQRVLDFANASGVNDVLFTSSGAVYGEQPDDLERIPETYAGAPDTVDQRALYGNGKRYAETLCASTALAGALRIKIARCFAFVGPHLPLDGHFAIGNFIRDATASGHIDIHGDGTSIRSYLYAADLAVWLWTILAKGRSASIYNVGSDQSITIRELAELTADTLAPGTATVNFRHSEGGPPPRLRYVPDIGRARSELGLDTWTRLEDGIRRTASWHVYATSGQ